MSCSRDNKKLPLSLPHTNPTQGQGRNQDVPDDLKDKFECDGYVVLPHVLSNNEVDQLTDRLGHIFEGTFDRGESPDKMPPPAREGQRRGQVRVQQVINVHKCDAAFRRLVTDEFLGGIVGHITSWDGVRLAQDQLWQKPPQASPLTFHRDSPYFMFSPDDVVTVWVALDDMEGELGPLEYVKGSHKWGKGRIGSSNAFFQKGGGKDLLFSAAEREGIAPDDLEFVSMEGLKAGGVSIHDGLTWHGSGKNCSNHKSRRGFGIHYVPASVRFTSDALKSKLWRSYVDEDAEGTTLSDEYFPIVWQKEQGT